MKNLWAKIGQVAFWCAWPALWVYLRIGHRTRVIIHVDGKVLVLKNWLGDGKWALPGGGLHRGEDSAAGALRETYEETGIKLTSQQLALAGTFDYRDKGFRFRYDLYSAELPSVPPTRKQRGEVLTIAWLSPAELTERNANREVVKVLQVWSAHSALLQ
jgi:8-oxo-dGTP pyrophosphatase MutT (NUDIX family)